MIASAVVDEVKGKLAGVNSVLIVISSPPGFDEVAAGLGLRLGLLSMGKTVGVACEAPMVVAFSQLVGVDKIKTEIGGENLVIGFSKAASENVERVSYDVDPGTGSLKLVVYPKAGRPTPNRSQISFERGGASGELVIAIGRSWGKFEEKLVKLAREKLIVVNAVVEEAERFGLAVEDRQAAAVSEVVARLLSGWGVRWEADLATNLFLGIEAGSRGFTARQVSAETFKLAAELVSAGARRGGSEVQGPAAGMGDWMTPKVYKGGMLT